MTNLQNIFASPCSEQEIIEMSPLALAFIGDGVHTMHVRDSVIKNGGVVGFHKKSAGQCNAKAQAQKLDRLISSLKPCEQDIVRRARNAKTHNIAKNSDIETYKKATSFEALVGYLYLKGDYDRLNEILKY
ncbi:MAG: Mini-ribonuclease 3 [Clostridia bacterium]|nr:Mini-ribonuclease 3 [Clostridia bacterium]